MDSKLRISIAAVLLLAAAAQAASANANGDFHLWLKCKVIGLYVNTTGANFTLPQHKDLLVRFNVTLIVGHGGVAPLPMIGVGELKMLNVSNPRAVFEKLRHICFAAVKELGKHLNKTVDVVYMRPNASKSIEEAANNTERGLQTLMRARNLLVSVNDSSRAIWIE